ncbi:hypothetical protein JNM87_06630 [Candidatus Saccharibacteria bacterium]|nr:hypothetical protein [Candidatus Saccharibacteria bacterium]
MKTSLVTLQGQDFIVTQPAQSMLVAYLKNLQRATRFRPKAYRETVEALRDVLLAGSPSKPVSKQRLSSAIALVGLPDTPQLGLWHENSRLLRFGLACLGMFRRRWGHRLLLGLLAGTVMLAVISAFAGLVALFSSRSVGGGWVITQTSIGSVRSWVERTGSMAWPHNWVASAAYSVVFMLCAAALLQLVRGQRRLASGLAVFVCTCLVASLWMLQRADEAIPPTSRIISGSQAAPLQSHMAYLQQCGDEIPYVFDTSTSGTLFRQLRDDGFRLAQPITTRVSDDTLSTPELCSQYDVLRTKHAKNDVVLQYYTQTADGTLRPYHFSDIEDARVTSSYGLFVKS